jgi:apolipoprotein D and lipocalin family protein
MLLEDRMGQADMKHILLLASLLLLGGCLGMPKTVTPVSAFDINRYLGEWYEIARLDHSFERGMTHVKAEYAFREDGGVSVINRGFSTGKGVWREARGKAYFVKSPNEGYLKVSFFGPFYGSYVIFHLDDAYQYAFVSGPDLSYLWLLSRTPTVSDEVMQTFRNMAQERGFDLQKLVLVEQQ